MLTGLTPPEETGESFAGSSEPLRSIAQHGDLVAARVDREQEPTIGAQLKRALRRCAFARAGAANRERRSRDRREGAVCVTVETGNGVDAGRVVVYVDLTDDILRRLRETASDRGHSHGKNADQDNHELLHS